MDNAKQGKAMNVLPGGFYQKILDENIKLHAIEAPCYEKLHPEEFNWFEQRRIWRDLKFIKERLPGGATALDIGCGTGNISLKLIKAGFRVYGVDISEEMLAVLKTKIPAGFKDKIKLFCENIDCFLDECQEQFNLVGANSVLHHLPDYLKTLKKAIGLLQPGGYLYIVHEPTRIALGPDRFLRKILWQVDNIVYSILNFGKGVEVKDRNYRISDYQLYHGFDEEAVVEACRNAGLDIVEFTSYSSAMRLGISCWGDSHLLKSKSQFLLIARKNIHKQ